MIGSAANVALLMTGIIAVHGGNNPAAISNALGLQSPGSSGTYAVYFRRSDGTLIGNGSASGNGSGSVVAQVAGYQFTGTWATATNGEGQAFLKDPQGDTITCSYVYAGAKGNGTCSTSAGITLTMEID